MFSDSDWAKCRVSRKSTSGGALLHGQHLLRSYAKTQSCIALSSGEAELYAMTSGCSEGLGLSAMARDYGEEKRPLIHIDASAAIGIAQRKGLGRVRHIDTQTLWVQEAVRSKRVGLEKVEGTQNPADMMTKALGREPLDYLLRRMGLVRAEGRSSIAPTLIKTDKGKVQDFEVEKEVDELAQENFGGCGEWLGASRDTSSGCCSDRFAGSGRCGCLKACSRDYSLIIAGLP